MKSTTKFAPFGLSFKKFRTMFYLVVSLFLYFGTSVTWAQIINFPDFTEEENRKINEYFVLVEKHGIRGEKPNQKSIAVMYDGKEACSMYVTKNTTGTIISIGLVYEEKDKSDFSIFMKPGEKIGWDHNLIQGMYGGRITIDSLQTYTKRSKEILAKQWMSKTQIIEFETALKEQYELVKKVEEKIKKLSPKSSNKAIISLQMQEMEVRFIRDNSAGSLFFGSGQGRTQVYLGSNEKMTKEEIEFLKKFLNTEVTIIQEK